MDRFITSDTLNEQCLQSSGPPPLMGHSQQPPPPPNNGGNMAPKPQMLNEKQALIDNLEAEKQQQPPGSLTYKLILKEIERVKNARPEDQRVLDVHSGKSTKISFKVLLPTNEYPQFNFVGKILGPKGNSLKRLQEETCTRMAILGRGSMRDKAKEEEHRLEGGKFEHLNEPLHVWVEAFAPPPEAFARLAHAVSELKKFLIPDFHDDIRQSQMEEIMTMSGTEPGPSPMPRGRMPRGSSLPMHGTRGMIRGGGTPGSRGGMLRGPPSRGAPRGALRGAIARGAPRVMTRGIPRGALRGRGASAAPPPARLMAFEEQYEEQYASPASESYASPYEDSPAYGKSVARGRGGFRSVPY